jgi:hypothetical protein
MNDFPIVKATKQSIAQRKVSFGVAVNDADYMTTTMVNGKRVLCPFYMRWRDMIKRCYDPKYHAKQPTYIDCSVCDSWLMFSNFRNWMVNQDWEGKELDKDLLVKGNKVYSPETCVFVSRELNTLLNSSAAIRGEWPIGVSFDKRDRKFQAQCSINGKNKRIGSYDTPEDAHKAYIEFKEHHVYKIALEQKEPLRTALLNWRAKETPN